MSEHDFEPVRGLPEDLPAGEHIVWQGAPDWKLMARRVFHMPLVSIYFGALMAWRGAEATAAGATAVEALQSALWVTPLATAALGLLAGLAWLNCRTTVYTITNKRVVMRFGAALTKAINIPFTIIEGADVKLFADGGGDIALTLVKPNKIAYLHLWPHARPGKLGHPQPTFRSVANAAAVASSLSMTLQRAAGQTVTPPAAVQPENATSPAHSQPALA
ncbi:MAG: photosynthetic complex putative assembly protein PuhB [Hyphomonadaceae bacterium]|nr:photosynthetic complex putative assembly protein PuhB [Hyphomonadaceae bacterium]